MKNATLFVLFFLIGLMFSCKNTVNTETGSRNLALSGKIESSSDKDEGHGAANATDNDLKSYWLAKERTEPQMLTVDLKASYDLCKISQTFLQKGIWKFKIEGSVDNKQWLVLLDKTKGAAGVSFAESVHGFYRYVRVTILEAPADALPSSKELAIFGADAGLNIAIGKSCVSSVSKNYYEPDKAFDNNMSSYWLAVDGSFPQSITIDLGNVRSLNAVQQVFKDFDSWKFKIEGSNDQLGWDMIADHSAGSDGFDFKTYKKGNYQYVKLTVLGSLSGFWANSCEFRIFGSDAESRENQNLAFGAVAMTSSFSDNTHTQYEALDGNPQTVWWADNQTTPQWLTVDLGNSCRIGAVEQLFANQDIWSFRIEGSNDNAHWEMLTDQTSGFKGETFTQQVDGVFRYIRLTVLNAVNGSLASSRSFNIYGIGSPKNAQWWENRSGMTRYYPKYYKQKLTSIIDSLDIIHSQGYSLIELSAPYEGDPAVWGGLGATNNYAIDPSIGTLDDFKRLVREAHARDIKIIVFGNVGYCWYEAPFFQKACDDERNDVYSKERKWFNFSKTKLGPKWFWSDRAQAFYYSFWGDSDGANGRIPNYNFNNKEWQEECRKYLDFWSDTGIDGLLLDAPPAYDGITDAIIEESIIKVLNRRAILTNAEGSWDIPVWIGRFKFKCIQGFDIYGWGGGKKSDVLAAMRAQNPESLNEKLKNYRDQATALGAVTITPPMWEIPASNSERLFEMASLSTLGTLTVNHYGDHHREYIAQFIMSQWPKEDQEQFYDLIRMQNSYAGLAPMGQRTCLTTNDDKKFLAFKRSNKDGNVSSLVILNFRNQTEKIVVNLKNSGILINQTPVDILNGTAAEPILSDNYEVTLPPYGYLFLGVENE